jgi:hypothetical protein
MPTRLQQKQMLALPALREGPQVDPPARHLSLVG